MIVALGEILFDIFPGYKRIGGAPFNFAYHMLKMGTPVNFFTKLGEDDMSRDIMSYLDLIGFNTKNVQLDGRHETGKVIVTLDSEGNPKFDILKDVAYDYIEFDPYIAAILRQKPDLIYFGSLAQRTEAGFKNIQGILSAREPATRCFYDVNLRPRCYTEKIVKESLGQSDVVKMNEDELQIIKEIFQFKKSQRSFIEYLMRTYGIEMLSITKGKQGSEMFTWQDSYQIENDPIDTIADTVGAGDAYASVVAIGYMHHWHPVRILQKATVLAGRICTIKGAIPKEADFYKNLIDDEKETV
jgi:fructokinase